MNIFKTEKFKLHFQKATTFFSHLSKVAIVIAAIFVGFTSGEIYHHYKASMEVKQMQTTRDHNVTSVAINDRREMMIIDRKTGTYQIFSDSVGLMIFNLYANQIYSTATKSDK